MSIIVSVCVIRIECFNDNNMSNTEKSKTHGRRRPKTVMVETYVNKANASNEQALFKSRSNKTLSNKTDNEQGETSKNAIMKFDKVSFVSGNPFVEVTKGILHLYKQDMLRDVEHDTFDSKILCILAVPATMTCHDLLQYIAAYLDSIEHVRIIRDGSVNQYMALIYFRNKDSTLEFYQTYNGTPFNSLEADFICQLVFVSRVEVLSEGDYSCMSPKGHTELPTCPVCLERMDESVDGILTILCNHSFHSNCLVKWGDTSCPVCRFVQTPEVVAENKCFECCSSESLWICLICGHVGCGRYIHGHAHKHYVDTAHCYSMQLGNNRVWDYVGDNFVHRLLQNKSDGKLVEGPSEKRLDASPDMDEKLDSVQLEYTYLLTSQLESQRVYYEDKMLQMQNGAHNQSQETRDLDKIKTDKRNLESKLSDVSRENSRLDKKVAQLTSRLSQTQLQLDDEKQMNISLQSNQTFWQEKFSKLENDFQKYKETKEQELTEMKEQLRDVMFYLEAQKSISESTDKDDIREGTIVIGQSSTVEANNKSRNTRRNKRR